jgi:hypothetical protein
MRSHFLLMVLFALITSTVVSLVTKENTKDQFLYFLKFSGSLIVIALLLAWVMYFFPIR